VLFEKAFMTSDMPRDKTFLSKQRKVLGIRRLGTPPPPPKGVPSLASALVKRCTAGSNYGENG
jgi:hypothetical protein